MSYSKSLAVVFTAVVCSTAIVADAGAQSRGRSGGGSTVGRAVPRSSAPRGGVAPRIGGPRVVGVAPYRPYYYPYRFGLGLGFYAGYPYYGYPYFYGYPYGYYGYPYGYAYGGYGYGAYGYAPPAGYVTAGPAAGYGSVRIEGAPRDAQVFADGDYVGVVDDFDGTFQHLDLPAGVHQIEIRVAGQPPISVDVNVTPGQTVTYHANRR